MSPPTLAALGNPEETVPVPRYRWGIRIVLPIVLLLTLAALLAGSLAESLAPVKAVDAVPVVQRPAIRATTIHAESSGSVVVQAAGWIEPDPYAVTASALTSGTVSEVRILEGQSVRAGDILATLVGDDAQLLLRRAEAEFAAAQEAWDSNIEATRALAVAVASEAETSASLAIARTELIAQRALQNEAGKTYRRRLSLRESGSVSESDFNAAEAGIALLDARTEGALRRIDELKAQLDRAIAERRAAEQTAALRTAEHLRLDLARVALDEARLRVARLDVRAPIDGVVMSRLVEPGSRVMTDSDDPAASHVAKLYDPAKLQVRVDVPLADAAKIGVSQDADVVVEVLPDRVFKGTVSRLTNLADIQKNTLQVKVTLSNPAPELKPEMLARVHFLARASDAGPTAEAGTLSVFVPSKAIVDGRAWVVSGFDGEIGITESRVVSLTGGEDDGWQEVATGLHPGDLVIISDAGTLMDGKRVRVKQEGN